MRKKYLFLIIFLISYSLVFFIGINIIYPSYLSTQLACNPNFDYQEVGIKIIGSYEEKSDTITINAEEGTKEYNKTLAHELTHYRQSQEDRLYDCSEDGFSWWVFYNELEAYSVELIS